MKNKKIAILGANSHIAKGLIFNFMRNRNFEISLFARSPQKIKKFLTENSLKSACRIYQFKHFLKGRYDVVINCVGLGTPVKVKQASGEVFKLTEDFDNLSLTYLTVHPKTVYINFSSGAAYCSSFTQKVNSDSKLSISVSNIKPENYYGIAKIYSEAKHRALDRFNIVDIRIFSYFSRFIDLDGGYFITDMLRSLKKKSTFITSPHDFVRDFLSPQDLFNLICLIIKGKPFNGVIDAYSSAPISKFKLLDYFVKHHSLKYVFDRNFKFWPTGGKSLYYSSCRKAANLGYKPRFSSLKTVDIESGYILKENR